METKAGTQARGVLAHIVVTESGTDLLLHDVEAVGGHDTEWHVVRLFTNKEFPGRRFLDVELTDAEYEDIGFNLVARLRALHVTAANSGEAGMKRPRRPRNER